MSTRSDEKSPPLVSVVIPVYNTELYLRECLQSVVSQTYTNWECIVLNNASTDASLEIAREFALVDSRIRIEENERTLPQIQNYNKALSYISAASQYTKMIDADNWLFPECLEKFVSHAERYPQNVLTGAYYLEGDGVGGTGLEYPSDSITGHEICRLHLLEGVFLFGTPTTVLYRSDHVRRRKPFFNQEALHADTELAYELLENGSFGFVHHVLSYIRVEPDSISGTVRDWNPHVLDKLIVLHKFGATYLTGAEHQRAMKYWRKLYYRYLGINMFRNRPPEFWTYHKQGLQRIGINLRRTTLLGPALLELMEMLLDPRATVSRLLRR